MDVTTSFAPLDSTDQSLAQSTPASIVSLSEQVFQRLCELANQYTTPRGGAPARDLQGVPEAQLGWSGSPIVITTLKNLQTAVSAVRVAFASGQLPANQETPRLDAVQQLEMVAFHAGGMCTKLAVDMQILLARCRAVVLQMYGVVVEPRQHSTVSDDNWSCLTYVPA